jgi:two-component system phosphate regulon response regulator PhoB
VTPAPSRLLVVEDEEDLLEVLSERLVWEGFAVDSAASLSAARSLLAVSEPHLVLLDLMLPDGSGLDFLAEIRATPSRAATPVLILSGMGEENSARKGLDLGANGWLTKPVGGETLVATIEKVLAGGGGMS